MIACNEAVDSAKAKNFLNEGEMERFLAAARKGRHGARNYCMALLAFKHGLRVSELVGLNIGAVDLAAGRIFVMRRKGSLSTSQPMDGVEVRAVKAWLRKRNGQPSRLLFLSERGPMTRQAFNYICAEIGKRAGLPIKMHPHALRHSCGYALANRGLDTRLVQDWLGHCDLRYTALYTRTCAKRFDGVWS